MAVLVFLDGVLKKDNGAPISQGVALFRSLKEQRRTLVLCDDKERTEIWLRENKINKIDDLVSRKDNNCDTDLELVDYCRSKGYVDLVVTADTDLAKQLLEAGVHTVVYLDPKYIRPEFRPDDPRGRKSWDELQSEIDRQDDLYREDPRL